jgi:hypothetical protein
MSRKADKIYQAMQRTQAGWHPHDFHTLYLGFGFRMIEGRSHTVFTHPDFPQLKDVIPRHDRELSKGYARDAVRNIETLLKLQAKEEDSDE